METAIGERVLRKNKIVIGATILAVLGTLILMGIAQTYRISGDCMEPAIKDGKLYFLNKLSSYFRKYRVGDIIVCEHEGKQWIARIAALENDTIQIDEQKIKVNNAVLQDDVHRNWKNWEYGSYAIKQSLVVPKNHVYLLSDDLSAHHDDSRVWGPIAFQNILGVIW